MPEQDRGDKNLKSADGLQQELLDFLKDADFGTPKYRALGDYLNLQDLEELLNKSRESLVSEEDPKKKLYLESRMRIEEIQIALFENQIAINKSTLKGYGPAYVHIAATSQDISMQLNIEGKNSDERDLEKRQHTMELDLWEEYFKRAKG